MKSRIAACSVQMFLCCVILISNTAIAEPYLFELLNKPNYLEAWNAMIASERNVDAWLVKYAKSKNGVATPGKSMQLNGKSYLINTVCKPHACGDNQFFVVFAPEGTKAWGLLLKDEKLERFFGTPDSELKTILHEAAHPQR